MATPQSRGIRLRNAFAPPTRLLIALLTVSTMLAVPAAPPVAAQPYGVPILIQVDGPADASTLTGNFRVFGWALDLRVPGSPRIDTVQVFLDRPAGYGAHVGSGVLSPRPDVAYAYGFPEDAAIGFDVNLTDIPEGTHTLYVYAFASQGADRPFAQLGIRVDPFIIPAPPATAFGQTCSFSPPGPVTGKSEATVPCNNPLTTNPATLVRANGVTAVVESAIGDPRGAVVLTRVCNQTTVRATDIRIEYGFYTQFAPNQVAQVSSDSYRLPNTLGGGSCATIQAILAPLGRWDVVRVDAVAWTPESF